jgi:signal transduction histidine kinase
MRSGRLRWSIRDLLIVLLVLTLAPFLVLEIFRAVADVEHQGQLVSSRSQTQVAESAQVTDDFLQFTSRSLASYASAPSVQSLDAESTRRFLESIRSQHPNYEGVFLLATDGTEIASTDPGTFGRINRDHPFVQQTVRSGGLSVSDVFALPGDRNPAVLLSYPVPGGDSPAAVLGIALSLDRINGVLAYARLTPGAVVLLMQRDGTVIAGSPTALAWIGIPSQNAPVRLADIGALPGTTVSRFPDQVARVTAYRALSNAPWMVAAGIPQSEVDAASREVITRVAEEVAIAALAACLLAWLMLRRVLEPIGALTDGARQFAAGDLDRRIPLQRPDELGTLASVLNGMAARLKRRIDEDAEHAQALESLNRLQADFVATASHELRTPVTAIRTYVEALLRPDLRDEGLRRECLEGINRTSARLANLARGLLDVSRIDSGQIPLEVKTVDAAQLARAAADRAIHDDSDSIIVEAQGLKVVQADPGRLEEVLDNLIGNAIKFSQPNARVRISVDEAPDGVCIAVSDSGTGIPASELSRIFDRFYQLGGSMGRRFGGSGLGLYIARAYVEAMGGRIWAESSPGSGSTFYVSLPAATANPAMPSAGMSNAAESASAARR